MCASFYLSGRAFSSYRSSSVRDLQRGMVREGHTRSLVDAYEERYHGGLAGKGAARPVSEAEYVA